MCVLSELCGKGLPLFSCVYSARLAVAISFSLYSSVVLLSIRVSVAVCVFLLVTSRRVLLSLVLSRSFYFTLSPFLFLLRVIHLHSVLISV